MRGQAGSVACAAILLSFLISRGVSGPVGPIVLSSVVFSYVVIASGRVFLQVFRVDFPLAAWWPIGVSATGGALWVLVALLGCGAATAFCLWAMPVLLLDLALRRRVVQHAAPESADQLGFIFCCAFTAAWCKDIAAAPKLLESSGQLPVWVEYFMHAGMISQFGDDRAIGRGVIWLSDVPLFAYHYSSYLLAAAFALPLDQPGLPLATSVWFPIGFLSVAAAAYTLGTCFAGATGGLAALVALFVIPDASNYGLRNGFFSFHWLLGAIPGSTYGLGSALLAVAFLQRWSVARSSASLAAGAAFLAATLLNRIQIFVLLAPAWLASVVFISRIFQKHRKIVLGGFVLLALIALALIWYPPSIPRDLAWSFEGGRALEQFLYQVHRRQQPTAYQGLYARILSEFGEGLGLTIGALLVYPASLGIFMLALPILYLMRRRSDDVFSNAFPVAVVLWYGAIMALAPIPAHTDATDFPHRSFVLLYATAAIWTFGLSVVWLSERGTHGKRLWQMTAIAAAIALPFTWMSASDRMNPKFFWGRLWVTFRVQPELQQAAAFLRDRGGSSDVFAAPIRHFEVTSVDAATVVIALTGMPAYVARVGVHRVLGGIYQETASKRSVEVAAIERAPDRQAAMRQLAKLGIRWYLATEADTPSWDRLRKGAAWTRGSFALYDSGHAEVATH